MGGDTCDIAEPTYKTFNLHTRHSTYLQDFQLTYETYTLPQTRLSRNLQDSKQTYKHTKPLPAGTPDNSTRASVTVETPRTCSST